MVSQYSVTDFTDTSHTSTKSTAIYSIFILRSRKTLFSW